MNAWLAYICAVRGHLVSGMGWGTNAELVVWANYCERCGAKLNPHLTSADSYSAKEPD